MIIFFENVDKNTCAKYLKATWYATLLGRGFRTFAGRYSHTRAMAAAHKGMKPGMLCRFV
jgi:hypothetical protein